ncbi:N-6-adenine-methyltransferase [Cloacibacterium rupense]|uniref:N-6-adenine-methyltransferase n=1 Tax=Cloacibacterium rupense TaxID=517423 RepID=A0ABQ2NM63_9FLAO|nr:DNA N-6-adenine-methyltransferase [Cloacibacterium rupense]GGP05102.1 N-6-adenine-methyltransferase [Cloacibacterium rupense]
MNVSFEKSINTTIEWLTPPDLVKKLGDFDLDPCTPVNPPFVHAKTNFNINDDGLQKQWFGRVYMNPPYGKGMEKWMEKLKIHGNGIALIFARTETKCFFNHIWNDAHAVLFVKGRIKFYNTDGEQKGTPGAPSILIAYGKENADLLEQAHIEGKFIRLK